MHRRLLVLLLVLTTVIVWSQQWHWNPTYDEPRHLWQGQRILQQANFERFDNSKMPVSVFNAAGWLLSQSPGEQGSWFAARLPQVGWLLGCVLLVFAWARRHHGDIAAVGAAALVALDPNLMAHAGLVTTDLPCTFFVLLACFTWMRMLEEPTMKRSLVAGAALGFAQAAKFTALFLGPIHLLTALAWCLLQRSWQPIRRAHWALLTALLALNLSYAFSGTFTPANQIQWKSSLFQPLGQHAIPLPVPRPWVEGVDWVKETDDIGQDNIYADGRMTSAGHPDYYFRALSRKIPLPLLILGILGLVGLARRPRSGIEMPALLVPPLFLFAWFSLAFNCQVGIRYMLPALPFFALWAARLPLRWLGAGVLWTLVSVLSWWPWGLSYFNETLLDRSQAWRVLADSNLDWGQADHLAETWLSKNPDGQFDPDVPTPGPVLLTANRLTGVLGHPARLACYRDHLPPSSHIAYALYPVDAPATAFEACFPRVEVVGGNGSLPAGEHLLVIRFKGRAQLHVGDHMAEANSDEETLLGAVVIAAKPFEASWTLPDQAMVYLDGKPIAGNDPV